MSDIQTVVTRQGRQRLAEFVARMEGMIVEMGNDEAALLNCGRDALHGLIQHDDWLQDEFAQPSPRRYQQYLVHRDLQRRFSVVSFVWGPGQRTPIHDHTTWGLIGMLSGSEISEAYTCVAGRLVPGKVERLQPGDVAVVSPTVGDIHCVRNAFADRVSISIHVYGGDIGSIERHIYMPEGGMKRFVSGYANEVAGRSGGAD
jgi:3-mercaptopropionate dioxygenase